MCWGYTGQDGEGRTRGRGRARGERQGRGRGERKAAAVAAASASVSDPISPSADIAAAEGLAQEQPRRGRRGTDGRARGGRDTQSSRGRGRAGKSVSSRSGPVGAPTIPTPSVASAEAPHGSALAPSQETKTTSADPVVVLKPPTAAPASVLPGEPADLPNSKVVLEPPAMPPGLGWDAIAPEPPGLGWGGTKAGPTAVDSSGAADAFPPASKPVPSSTVVGPDPPVQRPKSAAGVVSRPRSSGAVLHFPCQNTGTKQSWIPGFGKPMADDPLQQHDQASLDLPRVVHISNVNAASVIVPIEACFLCAGDTTMGLPGDVLPNGMPALPADLQLDAPLTVPKEAPKFAAPQATAEGSGFQGGLFTMPTQQTNSMWQQFGQQQATQQRAPTGLPQPQRDQSNPNLALASKGAWGAPAAGLSPMSHTQLNAFSSGPSNPTGGPPGLQFGQVISGGFGAFVPTGMCRSHVQIACRPMHLSKHL